MTEQEWKLKHAAAMAALEKLGKSDRTLESFVEMREDYVSDRRFCLTMVAFLPEAVALQIDAQVIEPLRKLNAAHYFYPPHSLHLAIQNVRKINDPPTFTEQDVARIAAAVVDVFSSSPILTFQLDGFLRLRSSLAIRAFSDENLLPLCCQLRQKLVEAGYPDDKDYVSTDVLFGNVTVCRYTHESEPLFVYALNSLPNFSAGLKVKEVCLITTNAICDARSTTVWKQFSLQ